MTGGNASNNDALSSQLLTDSKRVVLELLTEQLRTHINLEFLRMSLGQYQALKSEMKAVKDEDLKMENGNAAGL